MIFFFSYDSVTNYPKLYPKYDSLNYLNYDSINKENNYDSQILEGNNVFLLIPFRFNI